MYVKFGESSKRKNKSEDYQFISEPLRFKNKKLKPALMK